MNIPKECERQETIAGHEPELAFDSPTRAMTAFKKKKQQ